MTGLEGIYLIQHTWKGQSRQAVVEVVAPCRRAGYGVIVARQNDHLQRVGGIFYPELAVGESSIHVWRRRITAGQGVKISGVGEAVTEHKDAAERSGIRVKGGQRDHQSRCPQECKSDAIAPAN